MSETPGAARPANSYLTTLALAAVFMFVGGAIAWGIGVAQPDHVFLQDGANVGKIAAEQLGIMLMAGGVIAFLLWATAAAVIAGRR